MNEASVCVFVFKIYLLADRLDCQQAYFRADWSVTYHRNREQNTVHDLSIGNVQQSDDNHKRMALPL